MHILWTRTCKLDIGNTHYVARTHVTNYVTNVMSETNTSCYQCCQHYFEYSCSNRFRGPILLHLVVTVSIFNGHSWPNLICPPPLPSSLQPSTSSTLLHNTSTPGHPLHLFTGSRCLTQVTAEVQECFRQKQNTKPSKTEPMASQIHTRLSQTTKKPRKDKMRQVPQAAPSNPQKKKNTHTRRTTATTAAPY